jgi:hypothetical protein
MPVKVKLTWSRIMEDSSSEIDMMREQVGAPFDCANDMRTFQDVPLTRLDDEPVVTLPRRHADTLRALLAYRMENDHDLEDEDVQAYDALLVAIQNSEVF